MNRQMVYNAYTVNEANEPYDIDEMLRMYGIQYRPDELDRLDAKIEKLDPSNLKEVREIIIARRIKRQRELLEGLINERADVDHIEKIIEIALHEIDKQSAIKQSIETKAGIILAFFGVMVSFLFQSEELLKFIKEVFESNMITAYWIALRAIEVCWVITALLVLFFAVATLFCQRYSIFLLDDNVIKVATIDKNISLVTLIETAWHVANRNTIINNKKGKRCNMLIISIMAFAVDTVVFLGIYLFV